MNVRALKTPAASMAALMLAALAAGCRPAPTVPTATPAPTSTPAPSPTATPASESERISQGVDQAIESFMEKNEVSACSVAVVSPKDEDTLDTVIFNYGTLSFDTDTPVDDETQYEIGSLTKLFTGGMLAALVNEGLVAVGDPLQMYLPEDVVAPTYSGKPITLGNLATNTSGLPRRAQTLHGIRRIEDQRLMGYATNEEVFQFLAGYRLKTLPGTKWEYSNVGFGLIGIAMESAANSDYETLVRTRVAEPLRLDHTWVTLPEDMVENAAQGYTAQGDKAPTFATTGGLLAAGALRSTIGDLALYLVANILPPPLPVSDALILAQQPFADGPDPSMSQGLGWSVANAGRPDVMLVKSGETAGFSAYIAAATAERRGYVVVCNKPGVIQAVPALNAVIGQPDAPVDEFEDTP